MTWFFYSGSTPILGLAIYIWLISASDFYVRKEDDNDSETWSSEDEEEISSKTSSIPS